MYDFENILKKLILLCSENKDIELDNITFKTDLIKDCNFNSISIITLIVKIERAFNIEIDDEYLSLDKISSYNNLCKILKRKIK